MDRSTDIMPRPDLRTGWARHPLRRALRRPGGRPGRRTGRRPGRGARRRWLLAELRHGRWLLTTYLALAGPAMLLGGHLGDQAGTDAPGVRRPLSGPSLPRPTPPSYTPTRAPGPGNPPPVRGTTPRPSTTPTSTPSPSRPDRPTTTPSTSPKPSGAATPESAPTSAPTRTSPELIIDLTRTPRR